MTARSRRWFLRNGVLIPGGALLVVPKMAGQSLSSAVYAASLGKREAGGAASPLLTNLDAYWKLDEASGTRAESVGSNSLTDNNTVTSAAGVQGNAAQFTAANSEYLNHADAAALRVGDIDFTLACWIRFDTVTTTQDFWSKWDNNSNEWLLRYSNIDSHFYFYVSGNGTDGGNVSIIDPTFSAAANTWYFVVAWHDATANTINLQINNGTVQSGSHAAGAFVGTSVMYFGALRGSIFFADGRIDEAGKWSRVLTSTERTQLYNSGSGMTYPF